MSNDLHRFHSIHFYGLIWWDSTGTFCLGLLWYAIDCSGMFVVSHDRFWYTLHSALFVQFTIQLAIQHVHWEWCELPRKLTLQWRHDKQRDGVSIVCLTGCSGADQRKHQNSAPLSFGFWSIHNEKEIVKMSHTNDVGVVFKLYIFPNVCI